MKAFSQIQPHHLRDLVVEQVRAAIIAGHMRPGDRIVESSLNGQLGVSRTPVREALILLEREGLVVSYPNRGAHVRSFSEEDVDALFAMRTNLECFAAELLVGRFDETDRSTLEGLISSQQEAIDRGDFEELRASDMRFHQHLVERAGNPLLGRSWREIVAQVAAVLHLRAATSPELSEQTVTADHRRIVAAYVSGDLPLVRAEHERINERVARECRAAVRKLAGEPAREEGLGR